jgi:hypothetical protein
MAIGRITGQMLSSTLSRGTTNLTIGTTGQTNLLHVDATNDRIGIGLNNPSVQFQTTGSAIVGTDLTVTGNLTVNGSTTTVNTTNMITQYFGTTQQTIGTFQKTLTLHQEKLSKLVEVQYLATTR